MHLKWTLSDSPFHHYLDNIFISFSLATVSKTDSVKGDWTQATSDLLCHLPRNRQFLCLFCKLRGNPPPCVQPGEIWLTLRKDESVQIPLINFLSILNTHTHSKSMETEEYLSIQHYFSEWFHLFFFIWNVHEWNGGGPVTYCVPCKQLKHNQFQWLWTMRRMVLFLWNYPSTLSLTQWKTHNVDGYQTTENSCFVKRTRQYYLLWCMLQLKRENGERKCLGWENTIDYDRESKLWRK